MSMKSALARLEKYEKPFRQQIEGKYSAQRNWPDVLNDLRDKLSELAHIDPTAQKKYVDWMAKQAVEHSQISNQSVLRSINNMRSAFEENLPWFHNNAQRLGDIYKFTLAQINDAKNEHRKHKENDALGIKNLKAGEDYLVAFENKNVTVFQPLNYKASRSIGGNDIGPKFRSPNNGLMVSQMWCTTSALEHFRSHTDAKQRLFYIMDTKNNKKMAVHFKGFSCCGRWHRVVTFYNAADTAVASWGDHGAKNSDEGRALLSEFGLRKFVTEQRRLVAQ